MGQLGKVLVGTFLVISVIHADQLSKDLKKVERRLNSESCENSKYLSDFKVWNLNIYRGFLRVGNQLAAAVVLDVSPIYQPSVIECRPYPNSQAQRMGDCSAFQSISALEIDPRGRLWVLDRGSIDCPRRKLVILDLEDDGEELHRYEFPNPKFQDPSENWYKVDSLVLDHEDGGYAYISWNEKPENYGIDVYSFSRNRSWMIEEREWVPNVHRRDPHTVSLVLSAASIENKSVFYTYSNKIIVYVPVERLRNEGYFPEGIKRHTLSGQVWKSIVTADNVIYARLLCHLFEKFYLDNGRVYEETISPPHMCNIRTMSIDEYGNFWAVTWDGELFQFWLGVPNYQYHSNGSAPKLPYTTYGPLEEVNRKLDLASCRYLRYPSDFKVWKNNIYRSFMRYDGAEINMDVVLDVSPIGDWFEIKCLPFPNAEFQNFHNCEAFQSVSALELDPGGRLWVLDRGSSKCPRELVILDLEKDGTELHRHKFPSIKFQDFMDVRLSVDSLLLDHEDGGYAYIFWNVKSIDPGITVYSLSQDKSWRIAEKKFLTISNHPHNALLALSPASIEDRFVYYFLPQYRTIVHIPVGCLRYKKCARNVINRAAQSRGYFYKMLVSADGEIFVRSGKGRVGNLYSTQGLTDEGITLMTNVPNVDMIGIDGVGNFWGVDQNGKLYKTVVGLPNYQYYGNGSSPPILHIPPHRTYGPLEQVTRRLDSKSCDRSGLVSDFKVWKDKIYRAFIRDGDLNKPNVVLEVSPIYQSSSSEIKCSPYPNEKAQRWGDCEAFQSVSALEIDPRGRLWLLDRGSSRCPRKLVILDLEENGEVLRRYPFPRGGFKVSRTISFDYDSLVLDHEDGGYAYMSWNQNFEDRGIEVYSLSWNASWLIKESEIAQQQKFHPRHGVSLVLSSADMKDKFVIYYLPDQAILRIPVDCLRRLNCDTVKIGMTDYPRIFERMVMSADGMAYVQSYTIKAFRFTGTLPNEYPTPLSNVMNIDKMSIDGNGNFWAFDWNGKLYKSAIGPPNYQYCRNGSASNVSNHTEEYGRVKEVDRKFDFQTCGLSKFPSNFRVWKQNIYRSFIHSVDWINPYDTLEVSRLNDTSSEIKCRPYPNEAYQSNHNDCWAFRSVQTFEIDPKGRLWVLDRGSAECLRKLVILDLEKNGTEVRRYVFSNEISSKDFWKEWFSDDTLLLDHENGGYAYIFWNVKTENRWIDVYSVSRRTSWTIEEKTFLTVPNHPTEVLLALSPADVEDKFVYYCFPREGIIFQIPVACLRNRECPAGGIYQKNIPHGFFYKMIMSASGEIYIGRGKIISKLYPDQVLEHEVSNDDMISIDGDGYFWSMDLNFKIYKSGKGSPNYQYHSNGSSPNIPQLVNEQSLEE